MEESVSETAVESNKSLEEFNSVSDLEKEPRIVEQTFDNVKDSKFKATFEMMENSRDYFNVHEPSTENKYI